MRGEKIAKIVDLKVALTEKETATLYRIIKV
jgi:hypothetical protein